MQAQSPVLHMKHIVDNSTCDLSATKPRSPLTTLQRAALLPKLSGSRSEGSTLILPLSAVNDGAQRWLTKFRQQQLLPSSTTSELHFTAGSKYPITVGFWTGTTIPTVMRVSYHCRFLQTGSVLQLHCRSTSLPVLYITGRVQFHQHCRFIRPPGRVYFHQHCWFVFEPAVMAKPTLSVYGSSRQCHHCRFVANRQWCLRQHCRFSANRQWCHIRILLFYHLF